MSDDNTTGRKLLKTCDLCKSRKVKCSGYPGPCGGCVRRKAICRFRRMQIPRRPNTNTDLTSDPLPHPMVKKTIPDLYIDRLLAVARSPDTSKIDDRPFTVHRNGLFGSAGSYSLTFFSDNRLQRISARLSNNKVEELVQRISSVIASRVHRQENLSSGSIRQSPSYAGNIMIDAGQAKALIGIYFDRVHPFYPVLDQKAFESVAFGAQLTRVLAQNKAWSALYHSVLALGCQVTGGGSFEPGKGLSWDLFSKSLAMFPDLMALPDSVTVLQAMTTMAIYSLGISCLAIEHPIISEAARRAQNLSSSNLTGSAASNHRKIFWVLYSLEKISSFHFGRNSVFVDHNIEFPVPTITESIFENFDWFLTCVAYARLLSRAMSSLFCAGVLGSCKAYYVAAIDQLSDELEVWRLSIPVSIRPGERHHDLVLSGTFLKSSALYIHLLYNSFRLSLCRAMLHLAAHSKSVVSPARQAENTMVMIETSRSTLELTTFIDVQPYTPLWVLGGIPLTSHFVLFDLVINNPKNEETRSNLALLDIAGGHFSRIEYASGGCLPGSLLAEFAHIAREYVNAISRNEFQTLENETSSFSPAVESNSRELQQPKASVPQSCSGSLLMDGPTQSQTLMSQVLPSQFPSTGLMPPMEGTVYFPTEGNLPSYDEQLLGTDVMDLFNTFIPGIDPIFSSKSDENNGFHMPEVHEKFAAERDGSEPPPN